MKIISEEIEILPTPITHNSLGPDSPIETRYRELTPGSSELALMADSLFPSGVTHDSRYLLPYGIYVDRALGPYKWDVDGNRYVDFFGGHGALLLGHSHPEVTAATTASLSQGTHFGANHQIELNWAEQVKKLIPTAERVRFTSSGTEATQMAIRLARAATGKKRVMRFHGHFHGWHDEVTTGYQGHFDGTAPVGVLPQVANQAVLLPPGNIDLVAEAFANGDDIAAVILEPIGSATGMVPIERTFVAGLRELTRAHNAVLIFDEVVTGFRVSAGGAQADYGIYPDLSALAKILAGGMPGGAIVGRKSLMDFLDFEASKDQQREKIYHPGTFNANPVSAAAGTKALSIIASENVNERASAMGEALRTGLRKVLIEEDISWGVYGRASVVHLFTNPKRFPLDPESFSPFDFSSDILKEKSPVVLNRLRLALLVNGVDTGGWPIGLVSAAHDKSAIEHTISAFRESLHMLKRDSLL